MLDSYFFIPADKQKYIDKMSSLDADYFVLDLEESVAAQNKETAFKNILSTVIEENHYCRIPLDELDADRLMTIAELFNGRLILPKARTSEQVGTIINELGSISLQLIILIEHPRAIIELPDILRKFGKKIKGIGFGSHDFCSVMNMEHSIEHLAVYRKQLILIAKAFEVEYIDGVDLNIRDHDMFEKECRFAFEAGADGKFIIHPSQLDTLYRVEYFSQAEIESMREVHEKLKTIPTESMDVVEIDGKVYEKPHIAQIRKVIGKLDRQAKAMT